MPAFNRHSAQLLKRAIDSGITSPAELSNLMGQTSVESLGFTRLNEDLRYRSVDRAMSKVGHLRERHTHDEVATALASRDPETIANLFYDGRADLGNREAGDGWRFHGRGVIQLTGRDNYERYGQRIGVDLVENPDLAADPTVSADIAVAYWKERLRNVDRTDVEAVTRRVNGGTNGYDERLAATEQWASLITPELVEGLRGETISTDDLVAMNVARPLQAATLRQGAHGDDVRELQTQLYDLGYALRPDGDFGNATREAVATFQRNHGLVADGIAGPRTLDSAAAAHRSLREHDGPSFQQMQPAVAHEVTRDSSIHDMFEALCRAGDERNLDALCRVGHTYGDTPDGQDWLQQGERNNQQAIADSLAAQQAQQAQEQAQAPQQSGPVMSL